MEKEEIKKLLTDFAEFAHTKYMGCSQVNGKWQYSYDNEVVCMIDDYIELTPNLTAPTGNSL